VGRQPSNGHAVSHLQFVEVFGAYYGATSLATPRVAVVGFGLWVPEASADTLLEADKGLREARPAKARRFMVKFNETKPASVQVGSARRRHTAIVVYARVL
jgi:hypothetical protein